jgi:hypothetical protein
MHDPSAARRAALDVLGLTGEATPAEVASAYRRLAKLTHPDAAGPSDPDAALRFSALTDAYRTLAAATPPEPASPEQVPTTPSPARQRVTVRVRPRGTAEPGRPPIVAGPVTITPSPRPRPPR